MEECPLIMLLARVVGRCCRAQSDASRCDMVRQTLADGKLHAVEDILDAADHLTPERKQTLP